MGVYTSPPPHSPGSPPIFWKRSNWHDFPVLAQNFENDFNWKLMFHPEFYIQAWEGNLRRCRIFWTHFLLTTSNIFKSYWKNIHTYIHTYIFKSYWRYIHTYIFKSHWRYIHTYIFKSHWRYIHTYIHFQIILEIHTYIYTYIHTYIHTYIFKSYRRYIHTYLYINIICIMHRSLLAVWALWWLRNVILQCVTVHRVPKFTSCHNAIMVVTGRAHWSILL